MQGWVKLHRKFTDWEWYDDHKTKVLFIHLILKANHSENNWRGITVESGSLITSYMHLSQELSLSVQNIRTSLNKLKSTRELTIKTTSKYTHISINNWSDYQDTNTPTNKQSTNNQQTTNNQLTTNKNVKNVKNVKKDTRPTEKDFLEISEKYLVPESFVRSKWDDLLNYCESKGKKYKNYKSALSSWVKKDAIEIKKEKHGKSKIRFISS